MLLLTIRLRELTGRPRDLTTAFRGLPIFMIDLPIRSRGLPIAIPEVTPALHKFKIPLRDVTTTMHVFEIPIPHADNALHNLNFSLHQVTNALGRGRESHSVIEESLESIYFFSYKNLINFSSMSLQSNYLSSEELVEVYAQAESPFALLFQTHKSKGAHSKQNLPASLFLPHFFSPL